MKIRNYFLLIFLLITFTCPVFSQTDYKVRLKKTDGNGGLIVIKNAATRSAAETAALADSDHGSDTGAVDVEKIDSSEANKRGYASETTLYTISTNLSNLTTEVADATNTSTSNLTGGSTFTGGFVDLAGYEAVSVSVRVDQDSGSSGLVISWSDDGTNAIISQSFTVLAIADFSEAIPRRARYYKVAYTNGGVTTTSLAVITRKIPRFANLGTFNSPQIAVIIPKGSPSYASNQVSSSTSSGALLAARSTRRSVKLKNTDESITVYIGSGTVTSSNGYPLLAGQEITLTITTAINVIAASGTPSIAYLEEYD